jgi:hypothetical protein
MGVKAEGATASWGREGGRERVEREVERMKEIDSEPRERGRRSLRERGGGGGGWESWERGIKGGGNRVERVEETEPRRDSEVEGVSGKGMEKGRERANPLAGSRPPSARRRHTKLSQSQHRDGAWVGIAEHGLLHTNSSSLGVWVLGLCCLLLSKQSGMNLWWMEVMLNLCKYGQRTKEKAAKIIAVKKQFEITSWS